MPALASAALACAMRGIDGIPCGEGQWTPGLRFAPPGVTAEGVAGRGRPIASGFAVRTLVRAVWRLFSCDGAGEGLLGINAGDPLR